MDLEKTKESLLKSASEAMPAVFKEILVIRRDFSADRYERLEPLWSTLHRQIEGTTNAESESKKKPLTGDHSCHRLLWRNTCAALRKTRFSEANTVLTNGAHLCLLGWGTKKLETEWRQVMNSGPLTNRLMISQHSQSPPSVLFLGDMSQDHVRAVTRYLGAALVFPAWNQSREHDNVSLTPKKRAEKERPLIYYKEEISYRWCIKMCSLWPTKVTELQKNGQMKNSPSRKFGYLKHPDPGRRNEWTELGCSRKKL